MIQKQSSNLTNYQPVPRLLPHYSHIANLNLICLNSEMRKKSVTNYWYLVQQGIYPYTAFRKLSSLLRWAEERGLEFEEPLPAIGVRKIIRILGGYQEVMHTSYDEFLSLKDGKCTVTRQMSNGDWTMAIIKRNEKGSRSVHFLNPNLKDRTIYDLSESDELLG